VVGVSVAQLATGLGATALPALLALLVVRRRVRRRIAGHNRRAEKLVEYLAMWTRDRDWQATAAIRAMRHTTPAAAADVYRQALRDYSDEAWRVRREHRALHAAEGRVHGWLRARHGTAWSALALPPDCLAVLDRWREEADHDAAPPGLESRLRTLEPERRAA
jgi:hypothetical protein